MSNENMSKIDTKPTEDGLNSQEGCQAPTPSPPTSQSKTKPEVGNNNDEKDKQPEGGRLQFYFGMIILLESFKNYSLSA